MQVDRCYCYQQSFADLKRIADEQGAETVADLQEHVLFGQNCRLCHPYVRRMLKTGEIVFDEVIEKKP
jgi:bacterioferritin-associated ferredoxin